MSKNKDDVQEKQNEEVAPEEPQDSEPTVVDDSPAEEPKPAKSHTILDKDYTVDPDRGYRRQG